MKLQESALAATLLVACGVAFADGGGTFTYQGKTTELKGAYAYSTSNPFDASKPWTKIEFSDQAIDTKQIDAAKDRSYALMKALHGQGQTSVAITISTDLKFPIKQVNYQMPGESMSGNMGADQYKLELTRNDGERIEGTFRSTKEADKTTQSMGYYDLHFALDVASDPDAKN
jgi:hypothetical protein